MMDFQFPFIMEDYYFSKDLTFCYILFDGGKFQICGTLTIMNECGWEERLSNVEVNHHYHMLVDQKDNKYTCMNY